MKKKVLFAAAFMLATVGAYAQGNTSVSRQTVAIAASRLPHLSECCSPATTS